MNIIFLLKYGPEIFQAVLVLAKTIEEQIPDSGYGEQKRGLVIDGVLKAFIESADDIQEDFEKLRPALERMVNAAVTFYKAIGVFK